MKKQQRIVRVAMVKALAEWGQREKNMKLLGELLAPLAKMDIDVVITPECWLDGYMVRDRKRCTTRKLAARCVRGGADAYIKRVRRLAKKLNSYVVFGASERGADGTIRNAAYLLGREGEHVGTYYKVMPCHFYEPGPELPVFEVDFGTVGILICADRRWPEHARCLRLQGAEIVLLPTWGFFRGTNDAIMRTRAYENGIPICFTHPEQSLICLPDGSIGGVLDSNVPGVLVHDIDLGKNVGPGATKDWAGSAPIQNRRPELYGAIVAKK